MNCFIYVGNRKAEHYISGNWPEISRAGVATEEAEDDESCDLFPPARPFDRKSRLTSLSNGFFYVTNRVF